MTRMITLHPSSTQDSSVKAKQPADYALLLNRKITLNINHDLLFFKISTKTESQYMGLSSYCI